MLTAITTQSLSDAAKALKAGELVSFPTETVYGLGADATNDEAVARIYQAKGRPSFNPLIAHVATLDHAKQIGQFDERALTLAEAFWPGALTIVTRLQPAHQISELVTAGLETIALRMPAPQNVRDLIARAGVPIAAPSANKSGKISPTLASHVQEELSDACAYILDGGACKAGLESTIIDCAHDRLRILRPGPVTAEMIAEIYPAYSEELVPNGEIINDSTPTAPGQLTSHYAPSKSVRLDVMQPREDEIYIGFGQMSHKADFNLSPSGDLTKAAARLFAILHSADKADGKSIAVAPIDKDGIGAAIYDRLKRAAADRDADKSEEIT